MIPFLRLHAFDMRLRRVLKSLDADGMFDPDTGLLTIDCFGREITAAVADAPQRGSALSIARVYFEGQSNHRASLDGARIVGRLTRSIDFACLDEDGSILIALTQTDLRVAHLIARRIAAAVRQTLLAPYRERHRAVANITLAALKAGDNVETLLSRVMGPPAVAAE